MEVEYEFSIGDARDYFIHYVFHDPGFRKQVNISRLKYAISAGVSLLAGIYFWTSQDRIVSSALGVAAVALLAMYFAFPMVARKRVLKKLVKQAQEVLEGGARMHRLLVTDDGIVHRTPSAVSNHKWDNLEDVITTQEHVFIVVLEHGAVIVPRRVFPSEAAFGQFMGLIKEHRQEREKSYE